MPSVVRIQPTAVYPLPYTLDPQGEPKTFAGKLASVANTADALRALGSPIEVDRDTLREETDLLKKAVKNKSITSLVGRSSAMAAAEFLRSYGQSMALDVVQVRTALTNKLLALADCGDPRHELRAIELLGKHSDVSLFTERSEVTINYKDSTSLEAAIKERVKRLLNASTLGPEEVHYACFDADGDRPYRPYIPPAEVVASSDPDDEEAEFDDVDDADPDEGATFDPTEPDELPPLPDPDDPPEDWDDERWPGV